PLDLRRQPLRHEAVGGGLTPTGAQNEEGRRDRERPALRHQLFDFGGVADAAADSGIGAGLRQTWTKRTTAGPAKKPPPKTAAGSFPRGAGSLIPQRPGITSPAATASPKRASFCLESIIRSFVRGERAAQRGPS